MPTVTDLFRRVVRRSAPFGTMRTSLISNCLTPKPLAPSVYVHVPQVPSPHEGSISVMPLFPSLVPFSLPSAPNCDGAGRLHAANRDWSSSSNLPAFSELTKGPYWLIGDGSQSARQRFSGSRGCVQNPDLLLRRLLDPVPHTCRRHSRG